MSPRIHLLPLLGMSWMCAIVAACSGDRGTTGGTDASSGIECGASRCAAGQVCCIDCDGTGVCAPPGSVCTGAACPPPDASVDATGIACADRTCAVGETCCIDCDGRGMCAPPGSVCTGAACPPDAGTTTSGLCGGRACEANEICLRRAACPSGPEPEPECIALPAACGAEPSCGCVEPSVCGGCATCGSVERGVVQCQCKCICAAPDTPIATPDGEREIASLRPGDLVYSMHRGRLTAVPLLRVGRSAAPPDHAVVRVELAGGAILEMSPGHPTADGGRFGDLAPGALLGGVAIDSVQLVPYERSFTYDILPGSDTGTYVAAGALVGSTLFR